MLYNNGLTWWQAKYVAFLSSTRYSNPTGTLPQDHAQVLAFTKVRTPAQLGFL
jgi:hypothetical protein